MSIRNQFQVGAALFLILTAVACGQSGDRAATMADAPVAESMSGKASTMPRRSEANATQDRAGAAIQPQLTSYATQRSVIRKADIGIRVENVEKGEKAINHIVESIGGYVDSAESADLATANPTIDISLRVPVAQFDNTLEKFEALGIRTSKTVSSEDVTGQIVDLDARLKTMRVQEETYRGLLRSARQLNNVITLQDKLTEVRSEIESMAAQRKTLGGLAALSTVTVHLQQSATAVPPPSDPDWLAQAWGEATTTFSTAGRALTALLVWLAVFSPFWAPILVIAWRMVRPRRPAGTT